MSHLLANDSTHVRTKEIATYMHLVFHGLTRLYTCPTHAYTFLATTIFCSKGIPPCQMISIHFGEFIFRNIHRSGFNATLWGNRCWKHILDSSFCDVTVICFGYLPSWFNQLIICLEQDSIERRWCPYWLIRKPYLTKVLNEPSSLSPCGTVQRIFVGFLNGGKIAPATSSNFIAKAPEYFDRQTAPAGF